MFSVCKSISDLVDCPTQLIYIYIVLCWISTFSYFLNLLISYFLSTADPHSSRVYVLQSEAVLNTGCHHIMEYYHHHGTPHNIEYYHQHGTPHNIEYYHQHGTPHYRIPPPWNAPQYRVLSPWNAPQYRILPPIWNTTSLNSISMLSSTLGVTSTSQL